MATRILIFGATGYIGGSVLARLLEHPKRDSFEITAVIRSATKAKDFEPFGIKTIIGSLDDDDVLERAASGADVVIQAANADHLKAIKAILRGLKIKFEKTKVPPTLIHTSGTGVVSDNALGEHGTDTIYSDYDVAKVEALPITQWHRDVDVAIIEAAKQGYVKTHIVFPPTVWGVASNIFTEKGLAATTSIQVPVLIAASIARGETVLVGKGENVWGHVNVEEAADFYIHLLNAVISGKTPASGAEGLYFLENGEYTQYQAAKAIAQVLFENGKVKSNEPVTLTEEELKSEKLEKYYLGPMLSTNARIRGDRSRSLGWKPVQGTDALLASLKPEIEAYFKAKAAGTAKF